jgi:hypothetical protein
MHPNIITKDTNVAVHIASVDLSNFLTKSQKISTNEENASWQPFLLVVHAAYVCIELSKHEQIASK